uniref:Cell division protein FtsN n=1 Tax=Candidatus Kentrum sp. MB TaxID=2138164 RepID=A0A450X331_9GAMM|nr:MAG: cell division protein FtsN [Candidatus Kentron sp. MB]VFK27989.1 MAG: cell division protein FtsN [Candidatus Kentron sp. MB]VFK74505.1 MAG: cell division protein FtsN [Candidatus Kentron sp. MB]
MAHDYKHAGKASSSSSSGKSPPPGWLWFVAGLLIGLFITALTYLNLRHSAEADRQQIDASQRQSAVTSSQSQGTSKSGETAKVGGAQSQSQSQRLGPKFEFYTILPEREIQVPEHELRAQSEAQKEPETPRQTSEQLPDQATDQAAAPSQPPDRYILQVGSFRHLEDADRLKAKLVLGGFDVEIQTVSMDSGSTWHRVRLGPYKELDTVYRVRIRLQRNGFMPLVLKEKG